MGTTAEYDAFGPWIDEVHTSSDVPRLYRDYSLDLEACRLVLKVPRNISRRDVTPTMDLYDHLLIAGPERLTVLSRKGAVYTESTVAYDRIAAMEDSVSMLDGRFRILTLAEGSVAIHYNGSQQEVVDTLIRVLREMSLSAIAGGRQLAPRRGLSPEIPMPTPGLVTLGDRDVDLAAAFRHLVRREPDTRLLAAHGRLVLAPTGGAITRALHVVYPMTLHGALICGNGNELQVLSRRDWMVRGNRPEHSLARTVLSLATLDAVTSQPDPEYTGVRVVTLRAGATSIDMPVPADSAAERVLLSLAPAAV
jgi:hypothetical protein